MNDRGSRDRASVSDYFAGQAATVGRRASLVEPPLFLPRLAGADGPCLGVLRGTGAENHGGFCCSVAFGARNDRLFTGSPDSVVRCWDLVNGEVIWSREAGEYRLGDIAVTDDDEQYVAVGGESMYCIAPAIQGHNVLTPSTDGDGEREPAEVPAWSLRNREILRVRWSPSGGTRCAYGEWNGRLNVVRFPAGEGLMHKQLDDTPWSISWSGDGTRIAAGTTGNTLYFLDARSGSILAERKLEHWVTALAWHPYLDRVAVGLQSGAIAWVDGLDPSKLVDIGRSPGKISDLAWSPDGRRLASTVHNDHLDGVVATLAVWDVPSGEVLRRFELPDDENGAWRLAWAPNGAFIATSAYRGDAFRLWDLSDLAPNARATPSPRRDAVPLDGRLARLASRLGIAWELGCHPPLSTLRDALLLVGGQRVEGPLSALSSHRVLAEVRRWHWPVAAHFAIAALWLRNVQFPGWEPPPGLTPAARLEILCAALAGDVCAPVPPPAFLEPLRAGLDAIDDRQLSLLLLIGPAALAEEPGVILRLAHELPDLPPLSPERRRLLGERLRSPLGGALEGAQAGLERSGIARRGPISSLVPSELALPDQVRAARYIQGDLLYRARLGVEPQLRRPVVLVLDVSPPVFGPVEGLTRLGAHLLADAWLRAGVPVALVTAGGAGIVRRLERVEDLLELWTARSLEEADLGSAVERAAALARVLPADGAPAVVLLLSHVFADCDDLPSRGDLRALLVHYGGQRTMPPASRDFARWRILAPDADGQLADALAHLVS